MAQRWSLDSCLAYAIENNKNLLSQAQNQTVGIIDKKTAWTQLVPEVEFVAGLDYYWQIPIQTFPSEIVGQEAGTFVAIPTGTPWMDNYGLQLRMKLLNVEAWQDIKLSTLKQQAIKNEYLSLKKLLSRNVSMAFYMVIQQNENINIVRNQYNNYKEIHRLVTLQFDNGLIDKISYNQSISLLKEQEENYSKAESALQNALLDLKFWMGYPLNTELFINTDNVLLFDESAGFNAELLPNYEIEKAKVDIAKQQYKFAIAGLYPTINLKGSYGQSGFGQKISQSDWYTSGFIGIELRIPIFCMTRTYSPKRQNAVRKQREYEFSEYIEKQENEYLKRIVLLNEALKSIHIQRKNVELAIENEQLSRQKIEKGIIDMSQLKEVQQDLIRSQELLSNVQINYMKQCIEINYLQNKNSQN
jgi:outer membrane protein TolC